MNQKSKSDNKSMSDITKNRKPNKAEIAFNEKRFAVQGEYAESIFRSALGDTESLIQALERALKIDSEYAPAILAMGSVEYQRGRLDRGKKLFLSLVSLPVSSSDGGESDLIDIIDEAGDFLIQSGKYADGLELYKAAVERFPNHAVFHQGVGCCAGHEDLHDEAISASEAALELDPENQAYVNDLGWSMFEAGHLIQAKQILTRAVEMDPSDELARENLRICTDKITDDSPG
jgi:tetratricopeptide (TPR) repeat protein